MLCPTVAAKIQFERGRKGTRNVPFEFKSSVAGHTAILCREPCRGAFTFLLRSV